MPYQCDDENQVAAALSDDGEVIVRGVNRPQTHRPANAPTARYLQRRRGCVCACSRDGGTTTWEQ